MAITVYRLAHELYLLKVPVIPRLMTEYAHSETGIDIHPGATIDKYFFIDHGTGIVIGETSVIGKNVKIYQGVTIGALSTRGGQKLSGKKRHPTIKDNVTIYAGASILGGETEIGENSIIGGNTFITSSVPANTRVSMKNPEMEYRTHDKVVREEVLRLLKHMHDPTADLQIISLSQADNPVYCECDACKALDDANGSHAGTLITFVNRIARDVKEAGYDNVEIDTLAYMHTRKAPSAVVPEDRCSITFVTA